LAAKRHRLAIHVLPEKLRVPRVRPDQQRLEVEINQLFGYERRERRVADADETVVGEHFADEPAVKCERPHAGGGFPAALRPLETRSSGRESAHSFMPGKWSRLTSAATV